MTSFVSEDDVRFAAYEAGIKDPVALNALMRIINLRVYALARSMSGVTLEDALASTVQLYPCHGCGDPKPIEEFPESKRENPGKGVSCLACQGRRQYKCIGPCHQLKPLSEFPEHKQANPHVPSLCTYCDSRRVTRQEHREKVP